MRVVGQTLRVMGLILCGLAVLFYTGTLLAVIIPLVVGTVGGESSLIAGRVLGTLLADLIFLAIGMRLWKGLRRTTV